jgi:polysaccharide export outer membrane protein
MMTANDKALVRSACLGIVVTVGMLFAGGCGPRATPLPEDATLVPPPATKAEYVLGIGDQLAVKFYGNPELDQEVIVRPDGMISLPYVDEVRAAGLTPAGLDKDLTRRYTGELANPVITVIVETFTQQRIYVGGQVKNAGLFDLQEGTTLFSALAEAGGLTDLAHEKQVLLIRRSGDKQPIVHVVDVRPLIKGRQDEVVDPVLRPYDVVFVPRSKIANADLFVRQYIRDLLPVAIPTFPLP